MTDLSDRFKDCLSEAMKQDLNFEDTVLEALEIYSVIYGPIEVEDEEDGASLFNDAYAFVADATVCDMILRGLVEVHGIDDDGEMVYKATFEFDAA